MPAESVESIYPQSFLKLGRPAVRIQTMKWAKNIRRALLTVSDICPLDVGVVRHVEVLKLIFNITLPGDVGTVYDDLSTRRKRT